MSISPGCPLDALTEPVSEEKPGYPRFHLALPVTDLEQARNFYGVVLACPQGRASDRWIDFDFWGHQLVVHLVEEEQFPQLSRNPVDGEDVPAAHFGPILSPAEFDALEQRLKQARVEPVIGPLRRFAGRRGEQSTLFVRDPSGNHLEFKSFRNMDMLFATGGLDYP